MRIRRLETTTRWRRRPRYEVQVFGPTGELRSSAVTDAPRRMLVSRGGVHTTDSHDWVRAADDAFAAGDGGWVESLPARATAPDMESLAFDAERTVEMTSCGACGREYTLVKGFILDRDEPHAVYFAALHDHGAREAWIDVILGTFGSDDAHDHVTFGCRVGPIEGQPDPAATAVAAAEPYGDAPIFGRKLSREDALADPLLPEFWRVVDFVLIEDVDVHTHIYG